MKHYRFLLLPALLVGAILSAVLPVHLRCQTKLISTEALTKSAEVVAVGRVTAVKSEWDQNKTRIVTRVTMAVGEYLKGNASNVMTITSPGGEVDGVGEWYSHTARFQKDEDVLVFAERDKIGDYRVAGGLQGKFSIKKDEITSMARVSDQLALDDLKAQIRHILNVQQSK